jgi:hypothetical protein
VCAMFWGGMVGESVYTLGGLEATDRFLSGIVDYKTYKLKRSRA